jgi:hypothetical protein
MVLEYCQSQYGININETLKEALASKYSSGLLSKVKESLDAEQLDDIIYNLIRSSTELSKVLLDKSEEYDHNALIEHRSRLEKEFGVRYQFSGFHEMEHRLSFAIDRPATKEFKDTTARIFDLLLLQSALDNQASFWPTFKELNNKLMGCLSEALALEELRATIDALRFLSPQAQQEIINLVYPDRRKDLEAQIFRELRAFTGDLFDLWLLTLLVEFRNPANPLNLMEEIITYLKEKKAYT